MIMSWVLAGEKVRCFTAYPLNFKKCRG